MQKETLAMDKGHEDLEQHDDHIWLTIGGKAWAIRSIEHHRAASVLVLHLWRGYVPCLEYISVEFVSVNWDEYCEKAVKMLNDRA